ncbi:hypothetical protein OIU85_025660 [Salix viminalis]|uniref:Uncharacterized protein n=1 Tax=Salix viminalis TaxID=40686 RepID=A0A9Q0TLW1_SALVM|nr:hypothetical protein OIU85_025660 [Salix viminalis]
MVRGYGHGYYNTYPANYGPYLYRPMVQANGVGYYNTYEESMQARYPYLHHYPYYELPRHELSTSGGAATKRQGWGA